MLRWIIIFFVILLILRFLSRTRFFYSSRQQQRQTFEEKPEGEITVEKINTTKSKKQNGDGGEFVPYEEIK
jgi:cytoskeletal protein RodZ